MHPQQAKSNKSVTICITLEVINIYSVHCGLVDSEKIRRLIILICDPVALFLIFISLVPLF